MASNTVEMLKERKNILEIMLRAVAQVAKELLLK